MTSQSRKYLKSLNESGEKASSRVSQASSPTTSRSVQRRECEYYQSLASQVVWKRRDGVVRVVCPALRAHRARVSNVYVVCCPAVNTGPRGSDVWNWKNECREEPGSRITARDGRE